MDDFVLGVWIFDFFGVYVGVFVGGDVVDVVIVGLDGVYLYVCQFCQDIWYVLYFWLVELDVLVGVDVVEVFVVFVYYFGQGMYLFVGEQVVGY